MSEVKTIERKHEDINELIDIFKDLYGKDEPDDSRAVVTLTNKQMGVLIDALVIKKNVTESIDSMNEFAAELMAKENPTYDDKMQACFLAYALNVMKVVAMEGDEVDG